MFLLALLALPLLEILAFVGVGLAIGWLWDVVLLLGLSVLGAWLMRVYGRVAAERISRAVSERRSPGPVAVDYALGLLGCALLVLPGYITGALGAVLLLRPTRTLLRRRSARRYESRVMRWATNVGRFATGATGMGPPGARPAEERPADVDSTAVDDDGRELPR